MNVTVDQRDLDKAVRNAVRVSNRKTTLPVLNNFLLLALDGCLKIIATDLEQTVIYTVRASVYKDGSITVPATVFTHIVTNTNGIIELVSSGDDINLKLNVKSNMSEATILGIDPKEFPLVKNATGNTFSVDAQELKSCLQRTIFAVAKNDARPALNGVSLSCKNGRLQIAATDAFRLSVCDIGMPTGFSATNMIVPVKAMTELFRQIDSGIEQVTVTESYGRVQFVLGDLTIVSALIDGNYPDFSPIFPNRYSAEVRLHTQDLLRACYVVSSTAENSVLVSVDANTGEMCLSSMSKERGDCNSSLVVSVSGTSAKARLSHTFLIEVLKSLPEDQVIMSFGSSENQPIVIKSEETTFLHLIMPFANSSG